jgi:ribose transport system ATP-binding protein
MFAKALRLSPQLLLLDEPTQGIDVGAKEQIHVLVDAAAAEGVATLVASTDTDELVRLCHRVIVLTDGQIRASLVGDHIATERIEHIQLESSRRTS